MQQINYECQPATIYLEQAIMQCSGEPLFGTQSQMMATLGSFPKIQICPTFPTFQTRSKRQNRAGNHTYCPMGSAALQQCSAHATSLTKEPCLTFVAVEQPSIFKPCQKFTASPHSLAT